MLNPPGAWVCDVNVTRRGPAVKGFQPPELCQFSESPRAQRRIFHDICLICLILLEKVGSIDFVGLTPLTKPGPHGIHAASEPLGLTEALYT